MRIAHLAGALAGLALLATNQPGVAAEPYSPWAGADLPRDVFWGDTHLHTSISLDANLFGVTELDPADAFAFARGDTVQATSGQPARLARPLDFLVISDHAEYLGVMPLIRAGDPAILEDDTARRWRAALGGDAGARYDMMMEIADSYDAGAPAVQMPRGADSPWHRIGRLADAANLPGAFTAFIGFEWSTMRNGDNLHRVVVFADDAERTGRVAPYSTFDGRDPEDLWRYLARYEAETGGRALAIPHNSNLSGGRMFADTDLAGEPIDAEYARARSRWEPIAEVTQIKGDCETHPLVSPDDPFADYGTWDQWNITMSTRQAPWMQAHQYLRPALRLGLAIDAKVGVNPYRYGMIGSSDSHTALAAVEEHNFWGKQPVDEPGPTRVDRIWGSPDSGMPNTLQLASGYAAVWATENTRAALFDAMRRREVYATTGPRMRVRFFGGWDFSEADLAGPDPARHAYDEGVPMGADLPLRPPNAEAPTFLVWALKDPAGAHLDRVQIVKGWHAADGETRERVHDVVWSVDRVRDADGRLPAVGDTVDLETASYRNDVGAAALSTAWTDPDFDPDQRAFYYARVIEIPTPRWPVHDAVRFGIELPDGTQLIHQERAYTSPIWYAP